jgi:hypothetical protein
MLIHCAAASLFCFPCLHCGVFLDIFIISLDIHNLVARFL